MSVPPEIIGRFDLPNDPQKPLHIPKLAERGRPKMSIYLVAYLAAGLVFCLLDFIWLTVLAKDFYQSQIGSLMLAEPKLNAAAVFYVLYLFGLLMFAMIPALQAQNFSIAIGLGALLGLIAYATYDLSNLATLKGWSLYLSLVDIAWGAFVSASASTAGYFAARALAKLS
ncbi:MAG: DUF2177 family protein [Pseudomonadota bacterium]